MAFLINGDSLTKTYSSLADLNSRLGLAPGTEREHATEPGRVFKLVKNNHGSALTIGDWVQFDLLANDTDSEVKQPVTAGLALGGGVAMGAIPASGYGWICIHGYVAAVRTKGDGTAIAAGDTLKGLNAAFTMVVDQAAGTAPTHSRGVVALDASTSADATIEGFVRSR